jgi:hypothetical protein
MNDNKSFTIGLYKYGMRLRPAGMGCQPEGRIATTEGATVGGWRYHNFIYYADSLTDDDVEHYDLDYMGYKLVDCKER